MTSKPIALASSTRGETIAKGRPAIAAAFGRAGKKFVPRGGARRDPIDDDAWRRRILGRAGASGVGRHQDFELAGMREPVDLGVLAGAHLFGEFPQTFRIGDPGYAWRRRRGGPRPPAFRSAGWRCRLRISRQTRVASRRRRPSRLRPCIRRSRFRRRCTPPASDRYRRVSSRFRASSIRRAPAISEPPPRRRARP